MELPAEGDEAEASADADAGEDADADAAANAGADAEANSGDDAEGDSSAEPENPDASTVEVSSDNGTSDEASTESEAAEPIAPSEDEDASPQREIRDLS